MKPCTSTVIFLLCVLATFDITATSTCPSFCSCERNLTESTTGITVECKKSLRYVPQRFPTSTREILLQLNMMRTLSHKQFNGLENLVLINVSFNEITSIHEGAFVDLHHLEIIDLSDNQLRSLPDGMIENCTNVRTININRNLIHTFSNKFCPDCTNLEKINLRNNELSILSVDAFAQFDHLTVLDLRENKLTELSFYGVRFPNSIEELHLGSNAISIAANLKLHNARNLQILGLEMNSINDADKLIIENMTRLQFFNFSSNVVTSMPYTSFPLRSIHTLDFSGNRMVTLKNKSFVDFDGLRVVHLEDNELVGLPKCLFHRNAELTEVHIENNRLKEISTDQFCHTNRLSKLYLQDNHISQVKLSDMISLQFLNLNNNGISDGQLENIFNLSNITTLLLSGNNLINLTVTILRNFNSLQDLDLSRNRLIYIGNNVFSDITETLKSIDISQNEIEILSDSFKELKNLERLDLSMNRITSLPGFVFSGLHELSMFNISYNAIDTVEEAAFEGLDSVVDLDFSNNDIIVLPDRVFSTMKRLIKLDMSRNYIEVLSEDIFVGLTDLKFLNVKNNNIHSINNHPFASMFGLLELNLSNNQLNRIALDSFRGLSSLIKLNLSRNNIHTIDPNAFQYSIHIESIYLSYNKIANFQEILHICHENVKELWLDHNVILNTTGQVQCSWGNTETICLSFNQIKSISPETFASFPKLKYLDLKANLLEEVPQILIGNNIHTLNIANNNITFVGNFSFENLTKLIQLDLSDTCLKDIQTYAFGGLTRLEVLNLENNCLTNLKRKIFEELPNICNIRLHRNPWSCDCFLKEFLTLFLKKETLPKLELPRIICQSPSDLYLLDALDVSPNDMVCTSPVVKYVSETIVSHTGSDTLTLTCMAYGIPKPNLKWQDTFSEIINSVQTKTIQTDDGVLMVSEIKHAQIGDYVCTATNAVGEDAKSIEVQAMNQSMDESTDIVFVVIVTAIIAATLTITNMICCYVCVKNRNKITKTNKYRFKNDKPELRCYENKGRDVQDDYVTIGQHYQKSGLTHDANMDGKWKDVHKRYLSREDMIEFGQYMAERTMGYGVIRRFNSDHLYLNGHETSSWNGFGLNTALSDSNINGEVGCYAAESGEYSGPTTPIPLTPLEVAFKYGYKDVIYQDDPVDKLQMHVTDESMVEDFERTFTEKIKEYGDLERILKHEKHHVAGDDENISSTTTGPGTLPNSGQAHDKLEESEASVEPRELENDGRAPTAEVVRNPEHVSVIGEDDPVDTEQLTTATEVCKNPLSTELQSDSTISVSNYLSINDNSMTSPKKQTKGYLNEHYRAMSDDSNSDVTSLWDNISLEIDRLDVIEVEFEESMANLDKHSQCDSDEFSF